MRTLLLAASFVAVMAGANGASGAEPVRLYAAGSLRAAMTEIAQAFQAVEGIAVTGEFGPSGLLRGRIAKGEPAEVFASANMQHPESLHREGRAGPVVLFARNRLCALAGSALTVSPLTLLDRMLDPAVRLGTSTPKADPSGDYAWALFGKADKLRPGAFAALSEKAVKLTGGPDSPPPPKDRSVYGMLVAQGKADIFLTYCTNALRARKEEPSLQVVQVPQTMAVGADYGLTLINGASAEAGRFALFLLSVPGQTILARHGFVAPSLP